jgi:hypothetical protein
MKNLLHHVISYLKALDLLTAENNAKVRTFVQWSRGIRRGSAAARLLGLWVRIPPGVWMSVSCECCVLSGRGLFDELITRPEESHRVWCV